MFHKKAFPPKQIVGLLLEIQPLGEVISNTLLEICKRVAELPIKVLEMTSNNLKLAVESSTQVLYLLPRLEPL